MASLVMILSLTRAWLHQPRLKAACSRHGTRLLSLLSSSVGGEVSNEGIRVLAQEEQDGFFLLWKTSNVFVHASLDVQKRRRASIAVDLWLAQRYRGRLQIHTPLSDNESGLVLITPASLAAPLPPLRAIYLAIIRGRAGSLKTPAAGMAFEEVLHGPSGSFPSEGLSLVQISAPFATHAGKVKACLGTQLHRESKLSSGSPPLFSLVDIVCAVAEASSLQQGEVGRFLSSLRNSGQEDDQGLPIPPPPKFLKLLKREAILHQRLSAAAPLTSPAADSKVSIFRGLSLRTPSAALAPRESSGVLVETAMRLCPPPAITSVLDLGCGTGSLLLSFMHEHAATGLGLGLDLDPEALSCAETNARTVGLAAARLRFLNHSFSRVHELDPEDLQGGFDVILCNPPFLSERQSLGRVTPEGRLALVAGERGTECYEEIARSLVQCPHSILREGCYIVFQIPGGNRASDLVWESVQWACRDEDRALRLVDVVEDIRGIRRCMVLRLD